MQIKALFILLILVSSIFAQSIDIEVNSPACDNEGDLLGAIINLPMCIVEAFFGMLVSGIIYSAKQFFDIAIGFLTATPDLNWFCAPYNSIMSILESFYTIMLMGLGAYYIINSTDVEGRTKSKVWFKNIFFMIIALAFSFSIFGMILDINQYISTSLYSEASEEIFDINAGLSNLIFALVIAFSLLISGMITFFTLIIRYIMIPFLLFLFPIGIFLYFIPATKSWGSFIFKFSLIIIFMTSVDAILLLGMSSMFSAPDPNLASDLIKALALILGFGMIGLVNIIIYIIAILSLVSQAVSIVESIISAIMKIAIIKAFI